MKPHPILLSLLLPAMLHAASDVTISTAATSGGSFSGANPNVFTPTSAAAVVQASAIQTQLNAGTGVTIETASAAAGNGDITLSSAVSKNAGSNTAPMVFNAVRDLSISSTLSASAGQVPLTLNAGRKISITSSITTNGGAVQFNPAEELLLGSTVNAGAGAVTLQGGLLRGTISSPTITTSSLTIASGATLKMPGTVAGALNVAGSISPGAPGVAASLQVNGALALQAGSTTNIEVGGISAGSFDKVTSTGAVTIAGALQVEFVNNFHDIITTANSFAILQGTSISGTFTGLPNGSRYTLANDRGSFRINYTATTVTLDDWQPVVTTLAWDPGTEEAGTAIFSNTNTRAGRHLFKITTQASDLGGWRTRLTVTSGEAALYFSKTALPTTTSSAFSSAQTGSDGLVLRDDQYGANEEWNLMVYATEGAQWSLVSGKPFVHELGALPFTDSNGNSLYDIGEAVAPQGGSAAPMPPEGIRFYKTVVPNGTPAWSLWLGGSTREIALRSSKLPFHNSTSNYTKKQAGRMLMIPPVLGVGSSTWYSSIVAPQGEEIGLDSRIQVVNDLAYNGTVSNVEVNGPLYRVYRVQVPVDQIAWDINATAIAGNPDVAVRKGSVPGEFDNEAFSATPGNATEGITLVPNYLTDGTWYITTWSDAPYAFTLKNGDPVITPISFTDTKINDQPTRSGWRFYALTDIPAQVGALGWELELSNQVAGTQLAVRRNKVPGRWQKRTDGTVSDTNATYMDDSSTNGFIQRMNHQADVWYVGVFLPQQPLGAFTLDVHPITPSTVSFQSSTTVTAIPAQKWRYYRMDIGSGMLGWDLRLANSTGASCTMVVRRDQLPQQVGTNNGGTSPWTPSAGAIWASGYQWEGGKDWSGRIYDTVTTPRRDMNDRIVAAAGWPLVPGTYYIGIRNDSSGSSAQPASLTLESRGIGEGFDIPVGTMGLSTGSSVVINNLTPREAAYYKVSIPENTSSWEFTLDQVVGESGVVMRRGAIPDFNAAYNGDVQNVSNNASRQVKMQRTGSERYLMLPLNNEAAITPGDYYIGVFSEGLNPPNSDVIGSSSSSATLVSRGPLATQNLGTASAVGIVQPVSLSALQVKAYQFTVPVGTPSLEVRMDNKVGNPVVALISGAKIPQPDGAQDYGVTGGQTTAPTGGMGRDTLTTLSTYPNPVPGVYTLTMRADETGGNFPDASADLVIMANTPVPLAFNGTDTVTNHPATAWRYFQVTVPDGIMAWDIRLANITSGNPQMVIRRDQTPTSVSTNNGVSSPWSPSIESAWPSGYQWAGGSDWTGRTHNLPGGSQRPIGNRVFAAMGRPLVAGNYIVGILNQGTDPVTGTGNTPANYSIESRGVGIGQPMTVGEIPFAVGSTMTVTDLPRREAAFFKITVPANTPRWEFNLSPTVGEAMMVVRRGYLPDFNAVETGIVQDNSTSRAVKIQRAGMERYLLLPENNQDFIVAGDYYVAVVAEGVNPPASHVVGTGSSSATFTIQPPMAVADLGTVTTSGITQAVSLAAAEVKAFQFTVPAGTVSMEIGLENKTGNPVAAFISGTRIPQPDSVAQDYGVSSGQTSAPAGGGMSRQYGTGLLTFTNPPAGVYTATVRADDAVSPASANFVIRANAPQDLPLGGGSTLVTNHGPNSWKYFRVEVPANVAGWDLRVKDITGGDVSWAVRRDQIPANTSTNNGVSTPWNPSASSSWTTGYQWGGAIKDWTDRSYDTTASARREMNDRLVMAMGRPLEPGTYFIGILNGGSDPIANTSSQMSSYTIESRFIGAGQAIPIGTLGFAAGSNVAVSNLVPREAVYYKVSIPDNTPSWEFTFAPGAGEMMVAARQGYIPDFNVTTSGNIQDPANSRQAKVQKAGAERYLLLPPNNEDKIVAGDYYLAVVSEGVNPPNSGVIGTGTSSGMLTSNGSPAVTQLGTASLTPINHSVSLAGAQVKGYQFTVPEGVVSLELQLNNRTGNPRMALISGNRFPFPDSTVNEFAAGGGQSSTPTGGVARVIADSLITVPNPAPGTYSLTIRADDLSSLYPDATGDLVVVARPRTALNFAASQNGNGLSHSDTKQLADGQKQFYEIAVPSTLSTQQVIGWILKVNHASGDTTLKVYKTWGNTSTGIQITGNTALIVPPFLTFNETWFVEVTATGLTNYTLTSQPVTLERPAWQMPLGHNFTFGDSGSDSAGNPLPGDRGVDIGQDDWHIYAIDVPQGNAGLLRTELRAINGNPDLYIREDGVPTTDHDANGGELGGASLVHREMKDAGSEYGNWVPVDGRAERQLRPGRWYLGVKASGGSNARYRLLASTGNVTDLDLTNASVTNQTLIGRDWRYYRFTVPADAPATWNLGFTQQVGDVVMWVRDTVPSGQNTGTSSANTSIESWVDDSKNQGPYLAGGYDPPQVYAFNTPPLRPGHTYYAGFRANSDATFSVTSTTTGNAPEATPVSFYNGVINANVPAGGSALYKIAVPAEGTRLKWTGTYPSTVQLRLEQGTIPAFVGNQHALTSGANASLNQALTPTGWPWQSAQTYYLRIVNNGASQTNVLVNIAGVNAGTEDEDGDGLLDAWERQYFNSLTHNGAADPDGDGVTNSVEFTDGTNPNDINSAKYFLTVNANFGTVAKSPDLPKYDRGTNVTLTATPNPGLIFTGWTVGASGSVNPLQFAITSNRNITANFGVSLPVALDASLAFTTGGDGTWLGQVVTSMDGVDAAQSTPIGHSQQAWMETTVSGPGEMAFAWKVSSQAGDYLEFYIDGVLKTGRITGEVDWQLKSYAIDPGQHVLRWRYVKNGSGVAGSDTAWVDAVNWMPAGGYNQWVSDHFTEQEIGNPAIVGQDMDPDGDGVANIIEYAFGSEPRENGADLNLSRVTPEVVEIGGKKRLRLRFTLPEFIPADVQYEVEVTNDLGGWTVIADQLGVPGWNGTASSSIGEPVNGRREHIITDDATLAPTTRRFGRIKVTMP